MSWRWRTLATSSRKSRRPRKSNPLSRRARSGTYFGSCLRGLRRCTRPILYIEILSVPTYSCWRMVALNLVIWTWVKLPPQASWWHKPARPTIAHQRSGKISPILQNATFGHSGAWCMKWRPWNRHSPPKTCPASIQKFARDSFSGFRGILVRRCRTCSADAWPSIQIEGTQLHNCFRCIRLTKTNRRVRRSR